MTTNVVIEWKRRLVAALTSMCWLVAIGAATSGCATSGALKLPTNPLEVKSRVLKEIPLGTPLAIAEKRMRDWGFRCEVRKAGQFGDQITERGERGEYRRYQNIDYLVCRKDRVIPAISHRAWEIALVYDEKRIVTNVLVQVWNLNYL